MYIFSFDFIVISFPAFAARNATEQRCISVEGTTTRKHVLLLWLWPWPDDLDTRTWPRYSEDVPVYQKLTFSIELLKARPLQPDRQTDGRTDRQMPPKHYHAAIRGR